LFTKRSGKGDFSDNKKPSGIIYSLRVMKDILVLHAPKDGYGG
jgi:hypothetical protein